jgi:hypothetical protein
MVLLIGGIYEARSWYGFSCDDVHTKFHKDDSGIQKLLGGGGNTDTQQGDLISYFYFFFQNNLIV